MDIYSYLKKDHRKVQDLLEEVLAAKSSARREIIFEKIQEELTLHSEAEEATFYAALQDAEETEEWIEDAEDDHEEMKAYMEQLSSMSADSEKWLEIFGEFKHAVEHHVKDEEGRIFDKARDVLDDDEAEQLVEEMERMKEDAFEYAA